MIAAPRYIDLGTRGKYGPRAPPGEIDPTEAAAAVDRQVAITPRSALGRSQVVRQRILIPPFPGSNPGAPAKFTFAPVHDRPRRSDSDLKQLLNLLIDIHGCPLLIA